MIFRKENLENKLTKWFKIAVFLPYPRHYNPLLIRNHSWILTIHKARILNKKPLEKTFLDSKKWVKRIQTAGYNGAHTVFIFFKKNHNGNHIWGVGIFVKIRGGGQVKIRKIANKTSCPRDSVLGTTHPNSWQYPLNKLPYFKLFFFEN